MSAQHWAPTPVPAPAAPAAVPVAAPAPAVMPAPAPVAVATSAHTAPLPTAPVTTAPMPAMPAAPAPAAFPWNAGAAQAAAPAPVAAPAAPAAPEPAAQSDAGRADNLEPVLLAIVAEKTGYPADMLGMEMALEADLGIDSIKRVEILSALQERAPNLPDVDGDAPQSSARSATSRAPPGTTARRAPHRPTALTPAACAVERRGLTPRCSAWWLRRPATLLTCSAWRWRSRPTSASTPSSASRSSPRCRRYLELGDVDGDALAAPAHSATS